MAVCAVARLFLSTPSARRATAQTKLDIAKQAQFLSTPSARRATINVCNHRWLYEISIHALREEGDSSRNTGRLPRKISIHALREEGDVETEPSAQGKEYFYPRPPRGGRRRRTCRSLNWSRFLSTPSARRATLRRGKKPTRKQFLSTPSARRATAWLVTGEPPEDFYPRPPRGGRPLGAASVGVEGDISIHALREEGDTETSHRCPAAWHFYPRPPRGGRPRHPAAGRMTSTDFYPRPPRGGRLAALFA